MAHLPVAKTIILPVAKAVAGPGVAALAGNIGLACAAGAIGGFVTVAGAKAVIRYKDDVIQIIDKAFLKIEHLMKNAGKEIKERTIEVMKNVRQIFGTIVQIQDKIKGSDEKSVKAREAIQRREENIMKEVSGLEDELAALGFTEEAEVLHHMRGDINKSKTS